LISFPDKSETRTVLRAIVHPFRFAPVTPRMMSLGHGDLLLSDDLDSRVELRRRTGSESEL
jgi:hypothetical protein